MMTEGEVRSALAAWTAARDALKGLGNSFELADGYVGALEMVLRGTDDDRSKS